MNPKDIAFLNTTLDTFICMDIERFGKTDGRERTQIHMIQAADLKAVTGRDRLASSVIQDALSYFSSHYIAARWDPALKNFVLFIDLMKVALSVQQAKRFNAALTVVTPIRWRKDPTPLALSESLHTLAQQGKVKWILVAVQTEDELRFEWTASLIASDAVEALTLFKQKLLEQA